MARYAPFFLREARRACFVRDEQFTTKTEGWAEAKTFPIEASLEEKILACSFLQVYE